MRAGSGQAGLAGPAADKYAGESARDQQPTGIMMAMGAAIVAPVGGAVPAQVQAFRHLFADSPNMILKAFLYISYCFVTVL